LASAVTEFLVGHVTAKVSRSSTTIALRQTSPVVVGNDYRRTGGESAGWERAVFAEQRCRSKQVYLSKAEAKRVARLMSLRHGEALHLYRCSACGYYHVGHIVPAWQRMPPDPPQIEAPDWA
jgi:hypothetical protein